MFGEAGLFPMGTVHPTAILALPGAVRGPLAFALVLLSEGVIVSRYEGLIARSLDASVDHPLSSLAYGVAAHATILFAGVYLASQLGQLGPAGGSIGVYGLWLGVAMLGAAAGLGFAVVGTALVALGRHPGRWDGPLAGAVIAGLLAFTDPFIGGSVWLLIASFGIGGAVRTWVHATEDVDLPG